MSSVALALSRVTARSRQPCATHRERRSMRCTPSAEPTLKESCKFSRRAAFSCLGVGLFSCQPLAPALAELPGFKKDLRPVRSRNKIDPELFEDGPDGLRLYDVKVGDGAEIQEGDRVVVHYECKWRGITFVTSRQGVGVTGGEPYGFDVGATGTTKALKGLDLGVRGMRVGGLRKLIVPPNLGYGDLGTSNGEIPGGATLEMEVEVLSKKLNPFERAGLAKPNA